MAMGGRDELLMVVSTLREKIYNDIGMLEKRGGS